MRILIISQYFWPENFRVNDLCLELQNRGHEITVITGLPNYPNGSFMTGYTFFNNKIENIELKHTAFSRELFADGALNAAIWISKKNKGLFNMQDMFGLK